MPAAKELGLDAHLKDGFDRDRVAEGFSIPEDFCVPMLIAAGRFDQS